MVTIKDIAQLANVSNSTVSRILNNDTNLKVSSNTRQRVLDAANQLNYDKELPSQKKQDYRGIIAITSWYKKELTIPSLYLRSIRWGVELTLKNAGYRITRSFFNEEEPDSNNADGIIAIGHFDDNSLLKLKSLNKPLVVLNQDTLKHGISCVTSDYRQSIIDIIEHFESRGHEQIGMIEGVSSQGNDNLDPRSLIFRQLMITQNKLNEDLIFQGDFSIESGYKSMEKAIQQLKDDLPHAFFICSDTMAMGALRALADNNIPVPKRVSIIGYGDNEISQFTQPRLSTVRLATRQIGSVGALTLLNIINGVHTEPIQTITPSHLILRESTWTDETP